MASVRRNGVLSGECREALSAFGIITGEGDSVRYPGETPYPIEAGGKSSPYLALEFIMRVCDHPFNPAVNECAATVAVPRELVVEIERAFAAALSALGRRFGGAER